MDCPFSKADFLNKAVGTTMEFEMKPKKFGPGGFGYQKGGGISKVEADGPDSTALGDKIAYVRPSCIAHFLNSKEPLPSETAFMKDAKPVSVSFDVWPTEFSTGSFGWHGHKRQEVTVCGKSLMVNMNANAPINGSGKVHETSPEDPALAGIDPDAIANHLPVIGSPEKSKDDLTKIRGIGPWIEARLNRIKINSFKQLSKMDLEIQKDVATAIKYFPDRMLRDEWAFQAGKMVGGKWEELNPLFPSSGSTYKIKVDGEEYKRQLIDIANYAMNDGHIEFYEAEALWWSATDGGKVTSLEKKTLEHILASDSYKIDDEASDYLTSKLRSSS